jgi:hypothetical protein
MTMPDQIQITHQPRTMTMPDFRALCAELLQAWQFGDDIAGPMNRASTALKTRPQGEGPSEKDLYDLAAEFNGDPVPAMRRALEVWGGGNLATPPSPEAAVPEGLAEVALCALERIQQGDASSGSDDIDLVAHALGQLRRYAATPPAPEDLAADQAMAANLSALLIRESCLHSPVSSTHDLLQRAAAMLVNYGLPARSATPPAPEDLAADQAMAANLSALLIRESCLHSPVSSTHDLLQRAAAMLVNYGLPARSATPPAPEPEEVAKAVQWLLSMRELAGEHNPEERRQFTRAANLLKRLASPACLVVDRLPDEFSDLLAKSEPGRVQACSAEVSIELLQIEPVPVSERRPEAKDCLFNNGATIGMCWCFNPPQLLGGVPSWTFEPLEWAEDATHWLPCNAIPLPWMFPSTLTPDPQC